MKTLGFVAALLLLSSSAPAEDHEVVEVPVQFFSFKASEVGDLSALTAKINNYNLFWGRYGIHLTGSGSITNLPNPALLVRVRGGRHNGEGAVTVRLPACPKPECSTEIPVRDGDTAKQVAESLRRHLIEELGEGFGAASGNYCHDGVTVGWSSSPSSKLDEIAISLKSNDEGFMLERLTPDPGSDVDEFEAAVLGLISHEIGKRNHLGLIVLHEKVDLKPFGVEVEGYAGFRGVEPFSTGYINRILMPRFYATPEDSLVFLHELGHVLIGTGDEDLKRKCNLMSPPEPSCGGVIERACPTMLRWQKRCVMGQSKKCGHSFGSSTTKKKGEPPVDNLSFRLEQYESPGTGGKGAELPRWISPRIAYEGASVSERLAMIERELCLDVMPFFWGRSIELSESQSRMALGELREIALNEPKSVRRFLDSIEGGSYQTVLERLAFDDLGVFVEKSLDSAVSREQ